MPYYQFPDGEVADLTAHVPQDAKVITRKAYEAARMENARVALRALIVPKQHVTVVCTKSGRYPATSHFKAFVAATDINRLPFCREITHLVAQACGMRAHKESGDIVMGGCGYSKSFQLTYNLGQALWPNGTPEPHGMRNGEPDSDGGYALAY